jgi:hypothetical protein
MKKFLIATLVLVLLFSALSLVGCSGKDNTTRLGIGVYSTLEDSADAKGAENGKAVTSHTVAALIISPDGKIEKCQIDVSENSVGFTSGGKADFENKFLTKGELGDAYNMKAAGAKLEWYQQRDAFVKTVEGKSLREVKALVAEGGKGSSSVISAGCTIVISDFVRAIERAFENTQSIESTDALELEMKISTNASSSDADGSKNGRIDVKTSIMATAKNGEIKVATRDASAEFAVEFDSQGKVKGK